MKKMSLLGKVVIIAIIGLVLIQLIPYGRNHSNPPVIAEPQWDSPQTREIAKRACFDCHSNETIWPWYSNIAPSSWLVQLDTERGRDRLNFSEWGTGRQASDQIYEIVLEGEMPPPQYLIIHQDAKLQGVDLQAFLDGIQKTFGSSE